MERDALLATFFDARGSAVSKYVAAAELDAAQKEHVYAAIEAALTDAYYGLLLALDGSASLGGVQSSFVLTDNAGDIIADGDGRLEAAAWDAFRSNE
ncbi:MAG: hypothetical protein ABIR08_04710 [Sphingomonas sp.]